MRSRHHEPASEWLPLLVLEFAAHTASRLRQQGRVPSERLARSQLDQGGGLLRRDAVGGKAEGRDFDRVGRQ